MLLSGSGGTVTSLVVCLASDRLVIGPRFKGAISYILEKENRWEGAYRISERGVTYRCTGFCRKAPQPSCGDRSTKRHARGAEIQGREVHGRKKKGRSQKARKINTKDMLTHDMAGDVPETVYMRMMEEWVSANDKGREVFCLTW